MRPRRCNGGCAISTPRQALFGPAGMSGAIVETDRAGTLVGSSYVHATARDWARFGQLLLDNGVRDGTRILPKGWVVEATTPAAASPNGCYGFQLWLNRGSASGVRPRPSLPAT